MRLYRKTFHQKRVKLKFNLIKKMASRYFNLAYKFYEKGEFEKTISFYSSSIQLNSKNAGAYYNRGLALAQVGETQKAIKDFNRAIYLKPNYPEAFYNRGIVFNSIDEKGNAFADYNKAISLDNSVGAYLQRANFYYSASNFDKAIEDYTFVIENSGNSLYEIQITNYSFNGRGNCFYKLGEFDKALIDYSTAIEKDWNKPNPYNFRAAINYKKGLIESAIADYQQSLKIVDSATTNNGLGIIYYDQKQYQKAFEYFNRAIELDLNSSLYYQNRGNANLKLENYIEAIDDYTKAIELKNKSIQWSFKGRSMAYRKIGNEEKAIKDEDVFYKLALNLVENESNYVN